MRGAPATRWERFVWRVARAVDMLQLDVSMRLFRRGQSWSYCVACRAPGWARPGHMEYDHDGRPFGDFCERCVDELAIREWPCPHCSSMTGSEWVGFVHREVYGNESYGLPVILRGTAP